MSAPAKIRCAIYTRKSSEEGLEQGFNSLDAQHEACAAYIASQKHEGWVLLPARYDDGGISGGTLERPGVQRLLADIDQGKIDRVVVYKVDRLSRSLTDFSKLVERFDAAGCSFVSVTQSFNTATSMGRLTLNMLLSFAQFEREVTAERIRDKIAASKRKGMWMGGNVPLGYDAQGRTLVINAAEAATVRRIFQHYDQLGCVREVKAHADRLGLVTKQRAYPCGKCVGGVPFSRGRIYHLLANPVYIGRIKHRHESYEGQHDPIIDQDLWDCVQQKLSANAPRARRRKTTASLSPLAGKFIDETGDLLTPSHAVKNGRRYRYYISRRLITHSGEETINGWRLSAKVLEAAATQLIRARFRGPSAPARFLANASAGDVAALRGSLEALVKKLDNGQLDAMLADLIKSGQIEPGRLSLILDRDALALKLDVAPQRIDPDALDLSSGFELRRRGVEAKLILEDAAPQIDRTLLRNLAKAHAWFDEFKRGTTIREIAEREGTTRNRVAAIMDLAFLAPDIVNSITQGRQRPGLTSERLIKSAIPSLWSEQRTTWM